QELLQSKRLRPVCDTSEVWSTNQIDCLERADDIQSSSQCGLRLTFENHDITTPAAVFEKTAYCIREFAIRYRVANVIRKLSPERQHHGLVLNGQFERLWKNSEKGRHACSEYRSTRKPEFRLQVHTGSLT